jgi:hypothetical protein
MWPLEVIANEVGSIVAQAERELRLKDEARAARFEARLAAIELAAFKAEEDRQRKFEARMAELRDGKDGEPGKDGIDGKDADISHIEQQFGMQKEHVFKWLSEVEREVTDKLASFKDGKDGEPGKDADIGPIVATFEAKFRNETNLLWLEAEKIEEKVDIRLAEVKDGKDGEPGRDGKDADVSHLEAAFRKHEDDWENRICERIDSVKDGIDGKDGEPGKDADIEPLREELIKAYATLKADAEEQVKAALINVRDGKDGVAGEQGPPGKDGKDGQDGKLPIAREWTNRVHYTGDVVRHNGATYQALADTGREPPHGDWGELASRGTDGIGFVLRGTYDASAEYRQHDVVMINRNSFAAKYDNPGECPGDGWTLFAASGQRGKEGPPGSPGAKGADGRIVSITKWEADPDEMVLRIADSTGNTFTVDLQPIAERILEAAR